ncbi:M1 family metallopeptidase [Rubrivirga sp. IMCC45206]|uniref:M1 family metallopeptidase n=1 Tax=Rubrivirga sp. IMCC45206 TaxID=3391614 RepID=UPI0039902175
MTLRLLLVAALALAASGASAQRVQPYPVMPPPQFEQAVANGTRTTTGEPGPNYWTNRADYAIDARLDEGTMTLSATGAITYHNASPDSLAFLVLKLRQSVHAPGVPRNRPVAVTGGMTLARMSVAGMDFEDASQAETPGAYGGTVEPGEYAVQGTILTAALREPLAPGGSVEIGVDWSFVIPPHTGTYRQGTDGEVVYLGYWYPTVAVYDDVYGWHTDPYLGMGEHYLEFGDFRYSLDAPADMLVYGTGRILNEADLFSTRTQARLAQAMTSDDVVSVVGEGEHAGALAPAPSGRRVWRFAADDVRDVAVSASARYVWDATHASVDQDGDGAPEAVGIHAFYRPAGVSPYDAPWDRAAEFARFSIEHLSEMLWPYPWPHMTAVEGIIGGGMEYPMMTLIGGNRTDARLFSVTYHEIAHMWYPMMVGTNEKAYTWMDEGLTSFNTNEGIAAFWDGSAPDRERIEAWRRERQAHYLLAGSGYAVEPMRHNDRYPIGGGTSQVDPVGGRARGVASYSTPAVALHALRGIVGADRFWDAFRAYGQRWRGKHPLPYDLFNTFEDRLGQDLDWFWTPTFFETWTVDHALGAVETLANGTTRVHIDDLGRAPMPATVRATFADGTTADRTVPVQTWLDGATEAHLVFDRTDVVALALNPDGTVFDADPSNDTWSADDALGTD